MGLALIVFYFAVFGFELASYYWRPELLAWCAVLKADEPRLLDISPGAVAGMTVSDPSKESYRQAAPHAVDLARLGGPRQVKADDAVIRFEAAKQRFVARRASTKKDRSRPLVVVDVSLVGTDRLEVRSRCYPPASLAVLGFPLLLGIVGTIASASLVFAVVVLAMVGFLGTLLASMAIVSAPSLVDAVEAEIKRRLGELEGKPLLRVPLPGEEADEALAEREQTSDRRGAA